MDIEAASVTPYAHLPLFLLGRWWFSLGSQLFFCELFCRDQGATDPPYATDGLRWRRSRARSAGPTTDFSSTTIAIKMPPPFTMMPAMRTMTKL